jgi:phosphoribosylformylglycinamidine cyclo-ligase
MTDYLVCGVLRPERAAAIVAGVAEGCVRVGCALIGGETAEHPGHLGPDDFDLAGAATGVVEADALLGPARVRAGDVVIALASSGLHANGYSLARKIIGAAGLALDATPAGLPRTLGEELLTPATVYAPHCLAVTAACEVHALAHITGGGLAANLARVLPPGTGAVLSRASWAPPPVFGLLARQGDVPQPEMERVFNMGVGMAAVVAPADADEAQRLLVARGIQAWPLGEVTEREDVRLTGSHPPDG